jgi:Cu-processing system permease protein
MLRTRWVAGFGALFVCLLVGFAWFGTADLGIAGISDFSRTSVSLVNLVCTVVPLVAILAGVHAFAVERGAGDLLFSQPVRRSAILLGRTAGLFGALSIPILASFAFAGALVAWRVGPEGVTRYAAFAGLTLILALVFLCLGLLLASCIANRLRALGAALAAWFGLVLLYDLLVIGSTVVWKGPFLQKVLFASVFFDPVDLIRTAQLIVLDGASFFGPAGAAWVRFLGGPASAAILVASAAVLWVAFPAAAAVLAFRRRDL